MKLMIAWINLVDTPAGNKPNDPCSWRQAERFSSVDK